MTFIRMINHLELLGADPCPDAMFTWKQLLNQMVANPTMNYAHLKDAASALKQANITGFKYVEELVQKVEVYFDTETRIRVISMKRTYRMWC